MAMTAATATATAMKTSMMMATAETEALSVVEKLVATMSIKRRRQKGTDNNQLKEATTMATATGIMMANQLKAAAKRNPGGSCGNGSSGKNFGGSGKRAKILPLPSPFLPPPHGGHGKRSSVVGHWHEEVGRSILG